MTTSTRLASHWLTIIVLSFVLPLSGVPAALSHTVSGGGLSLDLDDMGAITAVRIDDRTLHLSSSPGGFAIRDVTDGNLGSSLLIEEGFEGEAFEWFEPMQHGDVTFTVTEDNPSVGVRSLFCQPNCSEDSLQFAALASEMIAVEPGTLYRIQCVYQASRGYLSSNVEWQRAIYEPGPQAVNGLGILWTDEEGNFDIDDYQLLVPFAKQARNWKPVGGEFIVPPGREHLRIVISARLDPWFECEAFWIDEIELFPSPTEVVPVSGSAVQNGTSVIDFDGTQAQFDIEATWTSLPDAIEVSGSVGVEDATPRAFDLLVSIPVEAGGWLWLDSVY